MRARARIRACAYVGLVLEQKKNKSNSACSGDKTDAHGGAEVSRWNSGVRGIPLMRVRRNARAGTVRRTSSGLCRQLGTRHERDVSVEDRLGDVEKAGYDRGIVVKVHRRLAREALVGCKNTGIRDILRDEKSNDAQLIRASMLRDFEQSLAHNAVRTVLDADDRSSSQHRLLF